MPPSVGLTRTFTGDYDSVFNAACWAAVESGMTLYHADRVAGVISLTTSASFASWGERVGVRLGQDSPGCVQVSARSELKFGLVDWGSNAKNLDRLFRQMDAALGVPRSEPARLRAPQPALAMEVGPVARRRGRIRSGRG